MSTSEVNLSKQLKNGEKTDWFTILPAELQTSVSRTSGTFYHPEPAAGLVLKLVLANETLTWTATLDMLSTDPAGAATTIYQSAGLSAAGTTLYLIRPGGGTNGLFTIVPFSLPREFQFKINVSSGVTNKMDTLLYGCFV